MKTKKSRKWPGEKPIEKFLRLFIHYKLAGDVYREQAEKHKSRFFAEFEKAMKS